MKVKNMSIFILVCNLFLCIRLSAQIGWIKDTIDGNFNGAYSVFAIDLDDDNDIDVLGAASGADDICWWKNNGGNPPTFTKLTIDGNFDGATSVFAIDLDGDNDIDVLGAAWGVNNNICWWENDGSENFTKRTIDNNFGGAYSVFAIDLDGDNDIDVLGAAWGADDITWWENDGSENFTKRTIDDNFGGAYSVFAIDLDNDNDIDVLGAASDAHDICWWKNNGGNPPTFTKLTIDDSFSSARSVFAIDLDDDNDIDVLGAAMTADIIAWWENDGSGNFTKHIIASFDGATSVFAIDLDNDNDVDVLGAAMTADDIAWWKNNGGNPPTFTKLTIDGNFDGATSVFAIDLDGDNDIDVLGAAEVADDITWWENQMIIDVGVISIDISSLVPVDTTLNPKATVKNFGTNTETFSVTCEINDAYTSTKTVTNLSSGYSRQVTFNTFTFVESGFCTVTVYTHQLVGDENPVNDTLEKIIEVAGIAEGGLVIPTFFSFGLRNNPAKGKTMFDLVLSEATTATLCIYDVTGRLIDKVLSGKKSAGYYEIPWTSKTTGIYFYKFESPWKTEVGKLVIVR